MSILIPLFWILAGVAVVLALLAIVTRLLVWRGHRRAPRAGETLVVDGVALHYVERGSGRPVVFLHGAGGTVYDVLLSVGPRLEKDYRLLAFDRPGSGYSGRAPRHNGSPSVQAELLREALHELGAARPVIVAHSAGAPVAVALALAHPDDVAGIVLVGGYLFSARDPDRIIGRLLTLPVIGTLLRQTVVVPFGMLLAPLVMQRLFFPDPIDWPYARVASALVLRPGRQATNALDVADLEADMRAMAPRFAELTLPIVAVHGLADYVVSAANPVRLAQLAPQTGLVLLEEVGHLPHFVRPQAVIDAVAEVWLQVMDGGEPPADVSRARESGAVVSGVAGKK